MKDLQDVSQLEGVWFVYDGECPVCKHAAQALRIKQEFGELHLLNAREAADHGLVEQISRLGYDLDEGMVIYARQQYYYGAQALKFMAAHGRQQNGFMFFCRSLFWSASLTKLFYPWMRGVRNWLIARKGQGPIDNLQLKNTPIFQSIFGQDWSNLPTVFKKHYANRPYTNDRFFVHGELDVMGKAPLTWIAFVMRAMGQIPVHNERSVPVTVSFESEADSRYFIFNRVFMFRRARPYVFRSKMIQTRDNEVVELMRMGLGWKLAYRWDGNKVVLSHRGYVLKCFGHLIPLPLTLILGAGYAEEHAIDDNNFRMITYITHPWWGKIYEYKGHFEVRS